MNSPNLWQKGVCDSGEAIFNFAGAYGDWAETTSGLKLPLPSAANPSEGLMAPMDTVQSLGRTPSLERLIAYNNHQTEIWATVDIMMSGFKVPENRFGASVEDLVMQPELAANAMRRWTDFRHNGLAFDFVTGTQRSNQIIDATPIGELTSLTNLSLDSNQIKDTAGLGNLINLEGLTLKNNYDYTHQARVTWDFHFLNNLHKLKRLDLSANPGNLALNTIAWSNLSQLESLELSDNGKSLDLNSIPWSSLPNLKQLTIRNSNLTNILALKEAHSLERLDLSRDQTKRSAHARTLEIRVDTETRESGNRIGEVQLTTGFEELLLLGREDPVDERPRLFRCGRVVVGETLKLSVDADHRR